MIELLSKVMIAAEIGYFSYETVMNSRRSLLRFIVWFVMYLAAWAVAYIARSCWRGSPIEPLVYILSTVIGVLIVLESNKSDVVEVIEEVEMAESE